MFAYLSAGFSIFLAVVLSYLYGGKKAQVKHEKELNDALEHEAQKWADISHTDDDFIRVQQERINNKRQAERKR